MFFFVAILIGLAIVIFLILRKKPAKEDSSLLMLQQQLSQIGEALERQSTQINKTLDSKISESTKAMQSQFSESAKIVRDVTEKLIKLDNTNKQVLNFSDQLKNLQDILKNPKQRGVLGEYYLEETLKNVLPPNSYQMQYGFKDGSIVDAVVFVDKKIIPVDSKFSLENYEKILNSGDSKEREGLEKILKQDLKARIDETSKYVKPSEKTMDFAFMFIPSEALYYDLLVNKVGAVQSSTRDLIEYAFKEKHVIIVSPTSFLAYLQTVLQGLRALQIEESAKEIRANVEKFSRHMLSYEDFIKRMGVSLGTTVNHYNDAYKEFKKIDKDVTKITNGRSKVEAQKLEKPETDN